MARVSEAKREELEAFWRFHHDEWARGTLNQREYCELHALPLKRFGNWRAQFKAQEMSRQAGLLYRRCMPGHMASHMAGKDIGQKATGYIPSPRAMPEVRRNFSPADKRRIVDQASLPGVSLSATARRYGITPRLLFRWKQAQVLREDAVFLPVVLDDGSGVASGATTSPSAPRPAIVEPLSGAIEIDLIGGRRLRFAYDTDPATIRAMVELLDGAGA